MEAKTKNIVLWVISVLVSVGFLASGAAKVFVDPDTAAANFESMGLPARMAVFIGICEMAGGIGVLIPRLAGLAGAGLVIIMLGAVYTHLVHTPPAQAIPALVLGGLSAYIAYSRGLPFGKA